MDLVRLLRLRHRHGHIRRVPRGARGHADGPSAGAPDSGRRDRDRAARQLVWRPPAAPDRLLLSDPSGAGLPELVEYASPEGNEVRRRPRQPDRRIRADCTPEQPLGAVLDARRAEFPRSLRHHPLLHDRPQLHVVPIPSELSAVLPATSSVAAAADAAASVAAATVASSSVAAAASAAAALAVHAHEL